MNTISGIDLLTIHSEMAFIHVTRDVTRYVTRHVTRYVTRHITRDDY